MKQQSVIEGNRTHDTFVIGINDGKITFIKSYDYANQTDEAQKDLAYVSNKANFSGWYISHVGHWILEHDNSERFKFSIPLP